MAIRHQMPEHGCIVVVKREGRSGMSSTAPRIEVRQESIGTTIHRLETFVARMERRYECSSEEMAEAILAGKARETAEIARWLGEFRVLTNLRNTRAAGCPAGSPGRSTR
ncbi:MAG: hypothetical protein L6Q80_02440 [Dehalococcoidia bacterium]|nr:hypothetical protein [Dehalococcoidia bacterium]